MARRPTAMSTSQLSTEAPFVHWKTGHREFRFLEAALGSLTVFASFLLLTWTMRVPSPSSEPVRSTHPLGLLPASKSLRIACHPLADEVLSDECVFDEMLNGWVPVECYDEALAMDSLRNDTQLAMMAGAGQFPWYSDLDFTSPLSPADLPDHLLEPLTNMTAFTLEKWHVAHCLYLWRLGLDAMNRIGSGEKGVYVNIRVVDAGHVNHCNRVIANQDHRRGAKATVTFGYGTCVQMA